MITARPPGDLIRLCPYFLINLYHHIIYRRPMLQPRGPILTIQTTLIPLYKSRFPSLRQDRNLGHFSGGEVQLPHPQFPPRQLSPINPTLRSRHPTNQKKPADSLMPQKRPQSHYPQPLTPQKQTRMQKAISETRTFNYHWRHHPHLYK